MAKLLIEFHTFEEKKLTFLAFAVFILYFCRKNDKDALSPDWRLLESITANAHMDGVRSGDGRIDSLCHGITHR
jgi:hypothetical protein